MPSTSQQLRTAPVFEIAELTHAIIYFLRDSRDLVSMACTSKKYTTMALRHLWDNPDFDSAPLTHMVQLFPEGICERLRQAQDDEMRLPLESFGRFDFYAAFVRHLHLWRLHEDVFIAHVLSQSRPGVTLFPHLHSIHIGAEGNKLRELGAYLSPSIRNVTIDHWDGESPFRITPSNGITTALLEILKLPNLESLDLLDTRYIAYEDNPEVIAALMAVLPQLVNFHSTDFTLLREICDSLSTSEKLKGVFLDLCETHDGKYSFADVVLLLRDHFVPLRQLVLLCAGHLAAELFNTVNRVLDTIDVRIDGPLNVMNLRNLTLSLRSTVSSLSSFRCSASHSGPNTGGSGLRVALEPLRNMPRLRDIHLIVSFPGEDMLEDTDIETLFPGWPDLQTFNLECDPEEDLTPTQDESVSYGLTLRCFLHVLRFTPHLHQIHLPYIDTEVIPEITPESVEKSVVPLDVLFSCAHVHRPDAVHEYLSQLWTTVRIRYRKCCHIPHSPLSIP